MSTRAVRKAVESTRICYMKTSGRELLEKGMELEVEVMEVFDLYSKLEASKTVKSHSTMRGQHSTRPG